MTGQFIKKIKSHDFTKAIVIVSLIFLITGIAGSFIYDENDEAALESLFRGLYLNTPIPNIDFGGFKGISYIYVFLYSKCDIGINYFGISLIVLNWWAFVLLTFFLLKKGPAKKTFWALLFLLFAFYNIFVVSLTTTSILAFFAAQLLFLYAVTDIESFRIKVPVMLVASLTILFAYLVRPTSGILAFLLFTPFLFWQIWFRKKSRKKILLLLVILPFVVSLFIGRQIDKKTGLNDEFDYKTKDLITKIVDYGYELDIKNKTQERLFYEIKQWFFIDKETQKIGEYEKLLLPPKKLSDAKYSFKFIFRSMADRRSLVFIGIILTALLMTFVLKPNKSVLYIFCISLGYYFGILVVIALQMKMVPRVLIPTLLIAIYFIFINAFSMIEYKKESLNRFYFVTLIFVLTSTVLYQGWSLARDINRENQKASKCLVELQKYLNTDKPEYVFLTWAYDLNYYPLKHIRWNPGKKLIFMFGWISYYPRTYSLIKELTGSNDIEEILKWISEHPDKATIYSDNKNNLILNRIFSYHKTPARLLPTRLLIKETGKGFYRVSFNGR